MLEDLKRKHLKSTEELETVRSKIDTIVADEISPIGVDEVSFVKRSATKDSK